MNLSRKQGFTLVELVATITIMAVLLVVIVPSIRRMQQENETQGYELYLKSALSAAKLYAEDKKEDLTGYKKWKGCVKITYDDLLSANLIKPYTNTRYDCSNLQIQVRKGNTETLKFTYSIKCVDTENGNKKVYDASNLVAGGCSASAIS